MDAKGVVIPPPLRIPVIIDTGAETSLISEQHMRTLGISPKGRKEILTATSDVGSTECNTYDIEFKVDSYGIEPFVVPALEVIARPFFNHSIEGMIGRDLLSHLTLTIEGPARRYKLDWPTRS